jgi:hypothetical protein
MHPKLPRIFPGKPDLPGQTWALRSDDIERNSNFPKSPTDFHTPMAKAKHGETRLKQGLPGRGRPAITTDIIIFVSINKV